jgi:Domain of unknown function (DUF4186)
MRDLDEILARLAKSPFRKRFRLGPKKRGYLATKGLAIVIDHARAFIDERLASANPRNDGKQTPLRGHPVFIAQHATATCCRSCLAKWQGIPRGADLNAHERGHVVAVLERWLRMQTDQRVANA